MQEERRRHKRVQMDLAALCVLSDHGNDIHKEVTTYNLSDTGVCFFTDAPLNEDTILQIHIPSVLDVKKTCVVKWCMKDKEGVYKVGVSFKNEHPGT